MFSKDNTVKGHLGRERRFDKSYKSNGGSSGGNKVYQRRVGVGRREKDGGRVEERNRDGSRFQTEDFSSSKEKKFQRPLLEGVSIEEVSTFYYKMKMYLAQVQAAQLSASKLREAKNLVYCITPIVMRFLVDFGFNELGIQANGLPIASAEQVTSDLFRQWVVAKVGEPAGADQERRKKEFREKMFQTKDSRFAYKKEKGTMLVQLQLHVSRINTWMEEYGVVTLFTEGDKIILYIRMITPWSLARCAVLAMTTPGYTFKTAGMTVARLADNYSIFVVEFIYVVTHTIASGIEWSAEMLRHLDGDDLTQIQLCQVGNVLREALLARREYQTAKMLAEFRMKEVEKYKSKPSDWKPKVRRVEVEEDAGAVSDASEGVEESYERIGGYGAGDTADSGTEVDDEEDRQSRGSEDTLSDEEFEEIRMRYLKQQEKKSRGTCTNCGKAGCFSATCKDPCKFCKRDNCNSWKCSQRPMGYGKARTTSHNTPLRKVHVRMLKTVSVKQIRATMCGDFETDKVLLDNGSDICCITQKMLDKMERTMGSRMYTRKLTVPVAAEFANGSTERCHYKVKLPVVNLHQRDGRMITLESVWCLVIPGKLEEFIIGRDVLEKRLGISVEEIFHGLQMEGRRA